ncbi:MAG: c-type cytochrome [Williamsia sp.]|nr:c-type cytochrome [Williamsia sp.]
MRKSLFVTAAIFALIAISLSFTTAADEPLYKNLKVLPKKITKPELDSVMRHFTRALGVRCNYCHVQVQGQRELNFASDDEEMKGEARVMMKMQNKINKKFFNIKHADQMGTKLEVTCYSCHHGASKPARTAPPQGQQGPPQGPPPGQQPGGGNPPRQQQ